MRVLLKKDFTIDLLSVDKVINVNDVMVSRLEVEVEENLLLPGERIWVVFSKTKDNPTDDITKEIQLATDGKTYSVAIPQDVVVQQGTWYFILSARKYYSEDKYFTRKATEPYEFTVEGGLWIDENTGEEVNIGTVQSLYETAVEKIEKETTNANDIKALQEAVGKEADGETEATGIYAKIDAEASAREKADKNLDEKIATKASKISVSMNPTTYEATFGLYANSEDEPPIDTASIDLKEIKTNAADIKKLTGRVNEKAHSISVSIDPKTYVATINLHDESGGVLSYAEIDLPTEELVVSGEYNTAKQSIVLMLRSGNAIIVPVSSLVGGLAPVENGKIPAKYIPENFKINDDTIKAALTKESDKDWTSAEKESVCETIGAAVEKDVSEALDGIIGIQESLIAGEYEVQDVTARNAISVLEGEIAKKLDTATGGVIGGNVSIQGNLSVSGTTTTKDTETVQVKENVIVANSDGATLVDDSGFAIKTSKTEAYGIMYSPLEEPFGKGVKIGLGSFTEDGKFVFDEGEAQFLATRADTLTDRNIPKWDNEKKQFVDSGKKTDDFVAILPNPDNTYRQVYIVGQDGSVQLVRLANAIPYQAIPIGDYTGCTYTGDPTQDYHATNKKYVDNVIAGVSGGGTQLYIHNITVTMTQDMENYYTVSMSVQSTIGDSLVGAADEYNFLQAMIERNEIYRFTGVTFSTPRDELNTDEWVVRVGMIINGFIAVMCLNMRDMEESPFLLAEVLEDEVWEEL